MIVPVILAGGSGTRLWPLSRNSLPKQFLPLLSSKTMLQETILRYKNMTDFLTPIVICHDDHRFIVAEQLKEIGITDATIILESEGKNTAPAATISALHVQKQYLEDTVIFLLPADHRIENNSNLISAIATGKMNAMQGKLVTFGIQPTYPEIGYGYIKISKNSNEHAGFPVLKFTEKPSLENAKEYIAADNYYWNSGMFMFHPRQLLNEIGEHAANILHACQKSVANCREDLDFLRLDAKAFKECPNESIDYVLMEKTKNAVLIPLKTLWSDVGSWSALFETQPKDENNNILQGDTYAKQVDNTYIRADHRWVVAIGLKDQIIIETKDVVLIVNKNEMGTLKTVIEDLKNAGRQELNVHPRVYRPWGYHEIIEKGQGYLVKRIVVKPNESLSLQSHEHRSEHWVVVKGCARVTRGEETFLLQANQSTYIPKKIKHRLLNAELEDLEIIEVQSGVYLGEDDIVRYEDAYGRSTISANEKFIV